MAVSDTKSWLQNKLGSTSELWNGESVSPFWTEDRLMSIQDCFSSFPPHIQVMILTSFLHIPARNVMMWRSVLEEIISLAEEASDTWVRTVGAIMRKFPSTGLFNSELEDRSPFTTVLAELKKLVRKSADMPPLECPYLNKTALASTVGNTPAHEKHFNLRRKPKSAALRAELLQKANEVANNKKNNVANSVPIKVRSFAKKMDDTTPMKPIPNRASVPSGFRTPSSGLARLAAVGPIGSNTIGGRSAASRKEGGIKFLDITEQPVGAKEAKRRKKQHEHEMMEQQKKEKEAAAVAAAAVAASVAATTTPSATPDYAAGLISPATPKVATLVVGANTTTLTATTPTFPASTNTSRITIQPTSTPTITSVTLTSATTAQLRQNLQQQLDQQMSQAGNRAPTLLTTPITQSQTLILSTPLGSQASPITLVTQKVVAKPGTTPTTTGATVVAVATTTVPTVTAIPSSTMAATAPAATTAAAATVAAAQAPVKRGLSLTRDQMLEAQEMFKTSNRVTRPEKALILGFMAGSRENPCPAQGAILNIRLSENEEVVNIGGVEKAMVAETFFQMNYQTGQWKRFKKLREVDKKQTVTPSS